MTSESENVLELKRRLERAMAAGRMFSFEWDPASDTVWRSENSAAILGFVPETGVRDTGENHFRHIHDSDRLGFVQLVRGLTPDAPEYETTYRFVRDDGRIIWLEESGRAEFDDTGGIVRVEGMASDATRFVEKEKRERRAMTDLTAAQVALDTVNAMSEGVVLFRLDGTITTVNPAVETLTALRRQDLEGKKYGELVENANSIIIRITPDHRILFFNEYAQRFFGYSAEEILGRSVIGTIVPSVDSEGRDLRKMTQDITARPELHGTNDNENICKDGRRVWIHWTNRALRDEHGVVREILCVGTDMTEKRRLTKEADLYRQRLQRLADRLTATEEQERRRVANHIHDTVVQTLSLSNIRLGGVMAALEKAGMSDQRERVEGVRQLLTEGIRECRGLMEELVPSLLYEVGLYAALSDFARKQAKTVGTSIRVEGDDGPKPLNDALRGLLFQCARELIMNAEKYAGPCVIRVSFFCADGHVQLRVQDNGRGFDPAKLDGGGGEAHDHTEGGFGLFNIRERLEGLGGRLEIDSAPDQGTTATVRIPLVTAS